MLDKSNKKFIAYTPFPPLFSMAKPLPLDSLDPGFYNQTAEQLTRRLPGEILRTPAGDFVIAMTKGFNDLVDDNMKADYDRRKRKPGDICITSFRGWPQVNIVGSAPSGKSQLTWLSELERNDATVKGPRLIQEIAAANGDDIDAKDTYDYAVRTIEEIKDSKGRKIAANVQGASSPLRVIENAIIPFRERHIAFLRHAEKATNSVGVGVLTKECKPMTDKEQLERLLNDIALELKVDPIKLRDPQYLITAIGRSARLRRIVAHLANDDE